jgi:hypothetical protein
MQIVAKYVPDSIAHVAGNCFYSKSVIYMRNRKGMKMRNCQKIESDRILNKFSCT